jgi:cytochrome c oxidase assembly protein subunit 15
MNNGLLIFMLNYSFRKRVMPKKQNTSRPVAIWLIVCCGMVFVMALLGAITRLTESGLSITDWNPVMGAVPPLNDAEWQKAFAGYRQIPQYQILHRGMTLGDFKGIYFWEWLHRLWGRLIGLVFALPLIWFALRKKIDKPLALRLCGILALGALQGFIGWFMVKSGLEVRTSVSPYRLALHLGFALLIYALMLWTACDLLGMPRKESSFCLRRHGWVAFGFLAVTMVWGAFTAGLHAGEAYNTWPLMDGQIVPPAAFTILPKWHNAFENLALVQFIHRWLGPTTAIIILSWAGRLAVLRDTSKGWVHALGTMAIVQVGLGLATLLTHANIVVATLHQAGAITLLTLMLVNLRNLKPRA